MRLTVWLVLGVIALYSGYWTLTSSALERTMSNWLEERRAEGWRAAGEVEVKGYPYRFETVVSGLDLADPMTGLGWQIPRLDLVAMALRPHQVLAFWPRTHTIVTPHERLTVTSDKMEGSLYFLPDTALALDRVALVLDRVSASSDRGWRSSAASTRIGFNLMDREAALYRFGFEAQGVIPSGRVRAVLDPQGALPAEIALLRIDAMPRFDRVWDRHAVEARRPQITALDLRVVRATWGDLDLQASGDLTLDSAGFVDGTLAIKARNWRGILTLMVNAGIIHPDYAGTVERALELMAEETGQTRDLDAPLTFANGKMKFGPIPLGPAPRLALRR